MTRSRQTADWGSRAGLAKIVPSSVAVGSGTGSADTTGTVTFSAVSSVALNGVFSATFRNYRIMFDITANTADATISMKYRLNTTDKSAGYYYQLGQFTESSSLTYVVANNQTGGFPICEVDAADNNHLQVVTLDIFRPFESVYTIANQAGFLRNTAGAFSSRNGALEQTNNESFDGINIIASSGAITGAVTIYGYN